jgi:hypothetical protein
MENSILIKYRQLKMFKLFMTEFLHFYLDQVYYVTIQTFQWDNNII